MTNDPPSCLSILASTGGDYWCDPLPVHLHGDSLPALLVSFSLLGGLLSLLCLSTTHNVPDQPQGALLRPPMLPPHLIMLRLCLLLRWRQRNLWSMKKAC